MQSARVRHRYFNRLVWPNYVAHNAFVLQSEDFVVLNGEEEPQVLFEQAVQVLAGKNVLQSRELMERSLAWEEPRGKTTVWIARWTCGINDVAGMVTEKTMKTPIGNFRTPTDRTIRPSMGMGLRRWRFI